MSGVPNTRYLNSVEYDQLIIDSEDINLLSGFKNYLSVNHQWKNELFQQDEEDGNHEEMPLQYLPENLPHNYNLENAFLEHFLSVIHKLILHPSSKEIWFCNSILIGNSKTSTFMLH